MKYACWIISILLFVFAGCPDDGSETSDPCEGSVKIDPCSIGSQEIRNYSRQITTSYQIDYLLYLPEGYGQKDQKKSCPCVMRHNFFQSSSNNDSGQFSEFKNQGAKQTANPALN